MYFDDLKVVYNKSQVVQSNNYYAFGMQTNDSWTRIDTRPNQYLYNAGSELNSATNSYEMPFRGYDPSIGRMNGVDIMVDKYASMTPYNYSMNDPVYYNDPSGAEYEWASMGGCGCWRDEGPQDAHAGGHSNGNGGNGGPSGVGTYYFGGLMFVVDWNNGIVTVDRGSDSGYMPDTYFTNDVIITGDRTDYKSIFSALDTWNAGAGSVWSENRSSSSHYRALSNEITQAIHQTGRDFAENPFGGALLALVSGGPVLGGAAAGVVPRAAMSLRVLSTAFDAGSQIVINSIANGGDYMKAISRINLTSVAISAINPKASFGSVAFNASIASAFELRLTGTSNNILTGKGIGDVGISTAISVASFGVFKLLGATSQSVVNNTRSMGPVISNLPNLGVGSSVYTRNAYGWAGSKVFSTAGTYAGFGATISTNIFGN